MLSTVTRHKSLLLKICRQGSGISRLEGKLNSYEKDVNALHRTAVCNSTSSLFAFEVVFQWRLYTVATLFKRRLQNEKVATEHNLLTYFSVATSVVCCNLYNTRKINAFYNEPFNFGALTVSSIVCMTYCKFQTLAFRKGKCLSVGWGEGGGLMTTSTHACQNSYKHGCIKYTILLTAHYRLASV
jgi:hypothetical protein